MHKNKLFIYAPKILIALLVSIASLSMLAIKPKVSEAQSGQNNSSGVSEGIQQRLNELKERMLTILQQEAQIKGLSYAVPSRFQGATIDATKLSPSEKVIALTFDDGPWPE